MLNLQIQEQMENPNGFGTLNAESARARRDGGSYLLRMQNLHVKTATKTTNLLCKNELFRLEDVRGLASPNFRSFHQRHK